MALYLPQRHDIVLQNPDDQFVAVVEVGNRQNLSREIATELRSNSLMYTLVPQTPYFLLLAQDVGFLWKEAWREGPETPPTYEFPMENVVYRYLKGFSGERLLNKEFETLIIRWLEDLVAGKRTINASSRSSVFNAAMEQAIR